MTDDGKISVLWVEVVLLFLLVLLGLGLGATTERVVGDLRRGDEPEEDAAAVRKKLPADQLAAASAQSALTVLQAKLDAQRLEVVKQAAAIEAFKQTYPALAEFAQGAAPPPGVPPAAAAAFAQAQLERKSGENFLMELEKMRPATEATVFANAAKLRETERAAKREFDEEREAFDRQTRWLTFGVSIVLALLVVVAAHIATGRAIKRRGWEVNRQFMSGGAAFLLFLLLAYQAFQAIGVILCGIVIGLAALALILRRA